MCRNSPRATPGEDSPAELGSTDEEGDGTLCRAVLRAWKCVPFLQLWELKSGEVKGQS